MTAAETLNRPPRTYADCVRAVIASKEAALAVTTHVHHRIAPQDELGRLRLILAKEEAATR